VHPLVRRLAQWHDANRPELLDELAAPATSTDLERLSTRVGAPLPEAFAELLRWHDGTAEGNFSGFQFNRQLMRTSAILGTMDMLDELLDAGDFDGEWWWRKRWLPFLDNGGGDLVCIDFEGSFGGRPGQIVEFWHDDADRVLAYPDFDAWLECFVLGLEAGLFEDDDGDLQLTDDDAFDDIVAERCPGYPRTYDADGRPSDDDEDDDDEP
jgi:cell wall assembly regulator SMI1